MLGIEYRVDKRSQGSAQRLRDETVARLCEKTFRFLLKSSVSELNVSVTSVNSVLKDM